MSDAKIDNLMARPQTRLLLSERGNLTESHGSVVLTVFASRGGAHTPLPSLFSQTPGAGRDPGGRRRMVRSLTVDEVEFELTVEPEDTPVRGNALCSGDDEQDREYEDGILERLDGGDVWAWAYVKVTARWNGWAGWDGLGGCCYEDERDFAKNSMYYEQMKQEALADLNRVIAESARKLEPLMVSRTERSQA